MNFNSSEIPDPPSTLTIADILSSREILLQREADDKVKLEAIGQVSLESIRPKLIAWALAGFPNVYPIHTLSITPPSSCSDGISRKLADYVVFCSGKSLSDHIVPLQAKLPDISVSFTFSDPEISIVVLKV